MRFRFIIRDLFLVITLVAILSAGVAFVLNNFHNLADSSNGPHRIERNLTDH